MNKFKIGDRVVLESGSKEVHGELSIGWFDQGLKTNWWSISLGAGVRVVCAEQTLEHESTLLALSRIRDQVCSK